MIEKAYGAKIRGSAHKKNHLPNQDNYLVYNSDDLLLAIVCDGLGSKKHSRIASKKLCKVIKKEILNQKKNHTLNFVKLINQCKQKWIKAIWPYNKKNCDTTCIFALITNKNILLAQVGDGLVLLNDGDSITTLKIKDDDFVNETISFGSSSITDWTFKSIKKDDSKLYKLLLCTDGISEDIIIDSAKEFIDELSNGIVGKYKNNKYLKDILKHWSNKYSTDDKTIVVVK